MRPNLRFRCLCLFILFLNGNIDKIQLPRVINNQERSVEHLNAEHKEKFVRKLIKNTKEQKRYHQKEKRQLITSYQFEFFPDDTLKPSCVLLVLFKNIFEKINLPTLDIFQISLSTLSSFFLQQFLVIKPLQILPFFFNNSCVNKTTSTFFRQSC